MDQRLSSLGTFILKYVFGPVWIIGFGFGTVALLLHPEDVVFNGVRGGAPPVAGVGFVAAWMLGTLFIAWLTVPLKRLRLRDGRLEVSNYFRAWEVFPSEIVAVRQNRWVNVRPVRVELRHDVPGLGRAFTFVPRSRIRFAFWREDPVVADLRAWAVGARPLTGKAAV